MTDRQVQKYYLAATSLRTVKIMESLQNGDATHFRTTPLFSMKTVLIASMQSCCSVDSGAWCKRALTLCGISSTRRRRTLRVHFATCEAHSIQKHVYSFSAPTNLISLNPDCTERFSWRDYFTRDVMG